MRRFLLKLVPALIAIGFAAAAEAQVTSMDFVVQANVIPSCEVQASTGIDFGDYDTLALAALDGAGSVDIRCTRGTAWTLNMSLGPSAAGAQRQMASGANRLMFNLFEDAPGGVAWDGVAGVAANRATITVPVHGRIPADQDVPTGAYSETLVATVTF
jgi:spore coat protein U-like protein